jgi:hypothetical protein
MSSSINHLLSTLAPCPYQSVKSLFGKDIDQNHQQVCAISFSSVLYIPGLFQVSSVHLNQSRQTIPNIYLHSQPTMARSSDVPTLILDHLIYAIIVAVVVRILLSRQRQQIIAGLPQPRHEERRAQDAEETHLRRRRSPLRTSLSEEQLRAHPAAEQCRQQAREPPTEGPQGAAPPRPRRSPRSNEHVIDLLIQSGHLNNDNEDWTPIFDSSDSDSSQYSFPRFESEHFSSALTWQNPPTANPPALAPAPLQNALPFYPAQQSGTVNNPVPPDGNTTSLNLRGGGPLQRRGNKKVDYSRKHNQRAEQIVELIRQGSRINEPLRPAAPDLHARSTPAQPQPQSRIYTQTLPPQDDSLARYMRHQRRRTGDEPWMQDWRHSQAPQHPQADTQFNSPPTARQSPDNGNLNFHIQETVQRHLHITTPRTHSNNSTSTPSGPAHPPAYTPPDTNTSPGTFTNNPYHPLFNAPPPPPHTSPHPTHAQPTTPVPGPANPPPSPTIPQQPTK